MSTVLSGLSIAAVSAMKWTPQNAMTALSVVAAVARQAQRVAHVVGHVLDLGHLVVVGQDDRVPLAGELAHLGASGRGSGRGARAPRRRCGGRPCPAWAAAMGVIG